MLSAPGHHGGAKEGHEHHDENLQFVGTEDGDAKAVAADDVAEIEPDRDDESIGERPLNHPHQTIDDAQNHSQIAPIFRAYAPLTAQPVLTGPTPDRFDSHQVTGKALC